MRIAGPASYALYSARLKLSEQPAVRRRFVLLVRELGGDALPMIRAGLTRLVAGRDLPVAALLAADLFLASPRLRDDEAADVTAPYLDAAQPGLAGLALDALVGFWGPRAAPLLVGLVGSSDHRPSVAAITGLRELSAVDEVVVLRIGAAMTLSPSADVFAAGRAALLEASGNTSLVAQRVLAQFV